MTDPRRRRRLLLLPGLGVLLGAVGGLLWYALGDGKAAVKPPPPTTSLERPLELAAIEVTRVAPTRLVETARLSGSVEPVHHSLVKSEVAATLAEVLVREGQSVRQGEVLARFQTEELAARLLEKQSNLEGARAELVLAEKTRAKNQTLRDKDIVAETSLDQAHSVWRLKQALVAAYEAQVTLARKALSDAVVRAPIDGVIAERAVDPGETLAVNAKLFSLVDLSTVEVTATVPAATVAQLKPGQEVVVAVEGFGDRRFSGRLSRINPVARAGTRAIPVYVAIDNPDHALRGGMFATGEAVVAESFDAVAVPPAAVRHDEAGDFVLIIAEGRTQRRAVGRGRVWALGDLVQVEGLTAGEMVVTADLPGLTAGRLVRIGGS